MMPRNATHLFAFLILLSSSLTAQLGSPVRATSVEGPISIDGRLDDPAWSQAVSFDAPIEVDPRENTPALQRTDIRIVYTQDMLYVAFVCHDSSIADLRSHISDRDRLYADDYVILIIDTYGDAQKAFEFFVNPVNVQGDALRAGENEDDSYEMVWQSAASIHDSLWIVELGIPFKSLRFPDRKEQSWKILAGRNYPRATRSVFSHFRLDRNNPCLTCQGVPLLGISGIEPSLAMEVLPYIAGSQSGRLQDDEDPSTPFEEGKFKGRAGVGLKIAPTPDMVVEAVVNPDFSQIESDAAQISVNTTFNLFYPERRPFFLEGSDLFRGGNDAFGGPALQLFYSRTINDPLVATKISGKSGSLSYGVIGASDRNTSIFVPGEEGSDLVETGMNSLATVGRARYDVGGQSYVGGIISHRSIKNDAANIVGGLDWNYRWTQNHSVSGVFYFSRTHELGDTAMFSDTRTFGSTGNTATYDAETYSGLAMRLALNRSTREENIGLTYEDVSPTFQAQNGFITRTNRRSINMSYGYTFYPEEGSIMTRWGLSGFTGMQFNHDGQRKERFLFLSWFANFKGQINANIGFLALNQELFRGVYFPQIPRASVNVSADPTSSLSLGFFIEAGNFINRDTPPELGYGHNAGANVNIRFTDRLRLAVSYNRARLASEATRQLFFDGNIYRATGYVYFNTESFLRVITQYVTFDKRLNFYPLFSYKLNAFTVFYAGTTRDLTNFSGGTAGWTTTQTQYFVKLQYLMQS